MHIVHTERQTDHKLRTQYQNSYKGVEVQVSAQTGRQCGSMVLCCNVNNEMMLGKQEHNKSLDVSRESIVSKQNNLLKVLSSKRFPAGSFFHSYCQGRGGSKKYNPGEKRYKEILFKEKRSEIEEKFRAAECA